MPSLIKYYSQCRKVLCEHAQRRETITYGELAKALGLRLAYQEWNTVLDPICKSEKQQTGSDLTLVVVYKSGPAKGLSRYFSNQKHPPRTTELDPRDQWQVQAYKSELEKVFDTYSKLRC